MTTTMRVTLTRARSNTDDERDDEVIRVMIINDEGDEGDVDDDEDDNEDDDDDGGR